MHRRSASPCAREDRHLRRKTPTKHPKLHRLDLKTITDSMKTKSVIQIVTGIALVTALNIQPSMLAQGTAFSYQGRLSDGANPANGFYDFQFQVFDAAIGGSSHGSPNTNSLYAVAVTNGLFSVVLDFGSGAFPGASRWLQIHARTNGIGAFGALGSRQQFTATPYAITAGALTGTLPAAQLSGTVGSAQIGGTYSSTVSFANAGNSFTGNGSGLTGVNAATVGGLSAGSFWNLLGNAGTTAGNNFVGTTDNRDLWLKVNNQVGLRLLVSSVSSTEPNLVGGAQGNFIYSLAKGGVIGGGNSNAIATAVYYGTIGGGWSNVLSYQSAYPDFSVIGGGLLNIGLGLNSVIGGGSNNVNYGAGATIAGGTHNTVSNNYSAIGGGSDNVARALFAIVGGGYRNLASGAGSFVGGGASNQAISAYTTISGGASNAVATGTDFSTISGGTSNVIESGQFSTISGGNANQMVWSMSAGIPNNCVIGGGTSNRIYGREWSTIGGGDANSISTGPTLPGCATIAGGQANAIGRDINPYCTGATIGGGKDNSVSSPNGTIAGGVSNTISGDDMIGRASSCSIGGGFGNSVGQMSDTCVVGGGISNFIGSFSPSATIAGGDRNQAVGRSDHAAIAGGDHNQAVGYADHAAIGGGASNAVTTAFGTVPGGLQAQTRNYGQMAYASGQFATTGDAQTSTFVCRGATTSATQTELFLDGSGARMVLPANSTWAFDILVSGRAANGDSGAYHIRGAIKNTSGATSLVGSLAKDVFENVSGWDATVVADDTNDALEVKVTGAASTSIRWVTSVRAAEVLY